MSKNDIGAPTITETHAKEIRAKMRGYTFTYRTGFDYSNGVRINNESERFSMFQRSLDIIPTEGEPADWIEAFIDLLRRFQTTLREKA